MNFLDAITVGVKSIEDANPVTCTFDGITGTFIGVFDAKDTRLESNEFGFTPYLGGTLIVRRALFTGTQPSVKKMVRFGGENYTIDMIAVDAVNYKLTLKSAASK